MLTIYFMLSNDCKKRIVLKKTTRSTLLSIAQLNNIPKLPGYCNGQLQCGSCHIMIKNFYNTIEYTRHRNCLARTSALAKKLISNIMKNHKKT